MAGDFGKKVQSDNKHLMNLTSSRYVHIDGSKPQVIVRTGGGRIINVVICTKGIAFIVRDGTNVIGNFATTSPENTYDFGVYFNTSLIIDIVSGTGSVNIQYDN